MPQHFNGIEGGRGGEHSLIAIVTLIQNPDQKADTNLYLSSPFTGQHAEVSLKGKQKIIYQGSLL